MKEKKNVCIIGPFPPPINGNSKALDTIVKSRKCQEKCNFFIINLSQYYKGGASGSLSLQKIKGILVLLKDFRKLQKNHKIDTYYLSNAQSTVGVIRDILILHQIRKDRHYSKLVLHLHGGAFKLFYNNCNCILKKLIKKYYAMADVAIVLGETLRNMFEGIITDEKVKVVPNCVDDKYLIEMEIFEKKIKDISSNKCKKIVYLSNMIESKGYKDVFKAALKYLENNPNVEFIFAGGFKTAEDEDVFQDAIQYSQHKDKITYMGVVQGEVKLELLNNADLFILPTYFPFEGQPISIIEAMGAGMPVITTNHAGIRDLIEDGVNGYFVKAKSPEDICAKLQMILDNPDIFKKMAIENRKLVLNSYLEENYLSNIMHILCK